MCVIVALSALLCAIVARQWNVCVLRLRQRPFGNVPYGCCWLDDDHTHVDFSTSHNNKRGIARHFFSSPIQFTHSMQLAFRLFGAGRGRSLRLADCCAAAAAVKVTEWNSTNPIGKSNQLAIRRPSD